MDLLSSSAARLLADTILALHVGIVLFVVFGLFAILIGAWRRWAWTRNFAFRISHLLLMVFIAVQAWLGQLCPLTVWEQALRQHAGQDVYAESFIEHWLSRLIFFQAPWWTFVAAYTLFAALVILCWFLLSPRRKSP
ncbi:MAG: DUF2784 domain-containing protein [Lysobacter sp.]|nr:DUF2784 domain-containing protein [Lysobacter sp.]